VIPENKVSCKRPYTLGRREARSIQTRASVLKAARAQLEAGGYPNLTMDSLATESGVTRQTVHNLFKTKTGVLEALFDQLALDGGMAQMGSVMSQGMQSGTEEALLVRFVKVFTTFWSRDRVLIRRIHGIGAVDPEFGRVVGARNQRRQMAATRIVERLELIDGNRRSGRRTRNVAALYALTSFEIFDSLAESLGNVQEAADEVLLLVRRALGT
jgi:AcrR family transcriptional regulator